LVSVIRDGLRRCRTTILIERAPQLRVASAFLTLVRHSRHRREKSFDEPREIYNDPASSEAGPPRPPLAERMNSPLENRKIRLRGL
jgi:hypothetical protein